MDRDKDAAPSSAALRAAVAGDPVQRPEPGSGAISETAADRLAAVTARAAGAPTAMIHTLTGTQLRLDGRFALPAGGDAIAVASSATLAHRVARDGFPVVVEDTQADPRAPCGAALHAAGVRAYAGFPIRAPDGEVVGACCVLDYRPRRWEAQELTAVDECAQACTGFVAERAARALAERQRLFLDALLDNMTTAVAACDADGKLVFANAAMRRLMPEDFDGNYLSWVRRQVVFDPDGRVIPGSGLPLIRALHGERLRDVELVYDDPRGNTVVLATDAQPILATEGGTLGALVAATDVTERQRTHRLRTAELAVSQALTQADSVEAAGPGVLAAIATTLGWPHAEFWQVDQDAGTLRPAAIHDAPGWAGRIAVPSELVCGHGLAGAACMTSDVIWIPDIADAGSPFRSGIEGVHTAVAVPIPSGGRTLAVLTFFADVTEDRPDYVVAILRGIAAHVGQFLERRRAEDLALALARSKDEYLGLIGHEMRTPLTSIAAYTDLLRELDPGEFAVTGRRLLDAVERNSSQLRHIVDELLDLAALDTGHAALSLGPCNLGDVVAEVVAGHPELTGGAFTVAVECPRACVVRADPERLRQVVGVLVGNAIAYSPDGGEISISVLRTGRRMAELTVTDTGIGIPESERDQLFGRFYRSSRARDRRIPGSGLALATCRAIIDRHHGSIAVVPTEGTGTAIRVRLPLYRSS
ncbi:MAG: hypothetical protein QOD41_2482 [Cryptosporangiaceae bacterium]|nr:hypothetical protein [Cryptosporangiaceae bacterium]